MSSAETRIIRIAGCSGCSADRSDGLLRLASNAHNDPLDVIVGDWMSEADMTLRGANKVSKPDGNAYASSFLEAFTPALPHLAKHKIKFACNAGASDTQKLHGQVQKLVAEQNLDLKVAWISGDEVLPAVQRVISESKQTLQDLHTGENIKDWGFKPIYAQAYLGGLGIAKAFSEGADIVICGRVSDASLTIGAAVWWHRWQRDQLDLLANSLIAGHLIECSSYVCGGNFSGFRTLENKGWDDIGYPIAEIANDGSVCITKNQNSGGDVNVDTCKAQLLYEIQGPWYFNSDVTADISSVSFHQLSLNRVALQGVKGMPPPPTTKVGLTAHGGFHVELHWFLVGLDIKAKAAMLEAQIRRLLAPHMFRYSLLAFTLNGWSPDNPPNQNAATVDFRIVAQAANAEDLALPKFTIPIANTIMQAYPGATPHPDIRTAMPRSIYEYFVTLIPQSIVEHTAHLPWTNASSIVIPPPPSASTKQYPPRQPSSSETTDPVTTLKVIGGLTDAAGGWAELPAQKGRSVLRETFGPWGRTVRGPLGWLVHARSGDKSSDCNLGLWVRHGGAEWDWLRSTLSVGKMRDLLGEEYWRNVDPSTGKGKAIERCEFKGLNAVHFLLREHLDRGVSCTSSYDILGKNVAEFIRARWVDLPVKFLERGRL